MAWGMERILRTLGVRRGRSPRPCTWRVRGGGWSEGDKGRTRNHHHGETWPGVGVQHRSGLLRNTAVEMPTGTYVHGITISIGARP